MQLLTSVIQFLEHCQHGRDVVLPEDMAPPDGRFGDADAVRRHNRGFRCRHQGLGINGPCIFRCTGNRKVTVCNQRTDGRGVEQLCIVGVGLDQATLDAAFKNGSDDQAHGYREVARQQPHPVDALDVRSAVSKCQREGHHRQPQIAAALGDTAFGEDNDQRRSGAQHHPRQHHIVADSIVVFACGKNAGWKEKHELVEVVGQYQKEQQCGRQVQKVRPFRQAVVLRLAQRQRHQHRQHWDEQHGQVVAIPQKPLCGHVVGVVFHRAQREPQQHQSRDHQKIPSHLSLNDARLNGDAPRGQQPDVDQRADDAQHLRVIAVPCGDAGADGADHQHGYKQHHAIFSFS